jgi:hypothetical protein
VKKSIIMKNRTFATTFTSFADFGVGCDQPEKTEPLWEPGKTETPEERQETHDNAREQNNGPE